MNEAQVKCVADSLERIGLVLGALYAQQMGDVDQRLKAERLSRCGFSNTEIADLLATTANSVNVMLHKVRKAKQTALSRR